MRCKARWDCRAASRQQTTFADQMRFRRDPAKRAGRLRQRHGLIVKGKRISCPPHYAPPSNDYDPPNHDYEHGFPLIRSLRASAQRSTSVLFSFVLCLLIVAGSFAIPQSKTILARSCAALTRLVTCACACVVALSRRPKGEIFRAVEPGRENDPLASRGKLQDITPCIPNGFRYEEITRRVKGMP